MADDGLTPLRSYSSVFSVWIGVVFLLLAARVWGMQARRGWLSVAVGLSGVIFLIGLNIANPEAVIMADNLNRDHIPILFHMEKMTADGNVVLAHGLDRLSPDFAKTS